VQPAQPEAPPVAAWQGGCDASAAVLLDDGTLAVVDDEDGLARVYSLEGGAPRRVVALQGDEERDLEGAARLGDRLWWVGSHGRNRNGKERPSRRTLLLTTPALEPVGAPGSLWPALAEVPEVGTRLAAAEALPPKEGGLAIEGLAAGPGDTLYIGLRSPLLEGEALVLGLRSPGRTPVTDLFVAARLDLAGRGIRSLEWDPGRELWWILAGPPGRGDDPALYRWDGAAPVQVASPELAGLNPEALAVLADGSLLVISDDGERDVAGKPCKDGEPAHRAARGVRLRPA
jgi:hypothetical protein